MFAFNGDKLYSLSPAPSGRISIFTSVKILSSPLYLLSQASLHAQTSPVYFYTLPRDSWHVGEDVTGLLCSSRTCYQDPQDPQDTGWELRLAPSFIPVDRFPLFS